jgi:F0F1-type ATP synthase membrane subunit b/b'
MASAKASADKIVQHGRDEAKRLHDEATNALSDTHNQLKVSTLELEHLNDAIAKAQTRYDGINAELKKLRERL